VAYLLEIAAKVELISPRVSHVRVVAGKVLVDGIVVLGLACLPLSTLLLGKNFALRANTCSMSATPAFATNPCGKASKVRD
jgi:hypothetical protein